MKTYERVVEFLATALLIIVGVLGVFVSVLDFIGADFENGPWKWLKGPLPVALLTVAILALALGLERLIRFQQIYRHLDNIERLVREGPERIIRSLNGVNVRSFDDLSEFLIYTAHRMSEARKSIDDLSWGTDLPNVTSAEEKSFEKYVKTKVAICKKGIRYREVMSFSLPSHVQRAESILSQNLTSYSLKFYDFDKQSAPPLIQFLIVDSEEVMFAFYRWPYLPAEKEVRLAVRHPDIVKLFQDYYDTIWHGARPLKIGNRVEQSTFQELKKRWNKG